MTKTLYRGTQGSMKMMNDIENVRFVEMTYDYTITFDIDEIANANNFIPSDVEAVECGK